MTDLQKLGYQALPIGTLIRLRDHGVSAEYITDLAQIGYARLSVEDLVSLRDHGVSPSGCVAPMHRRVHGFPSTGCGTLLPEGAVRRRTMRLQLLNTSRLLVEP